jgi:hypothetical protein
MLNLIAPLFAYLSVGCATLALLQRFWKNASQHWLILTFGMPLVFGYFCYYLAIKSLFLCHLLSLGITLPCMAWTTFRIITGRLPLPETEWRWYRPFLTLTLLMVLLNSAVLHLGYQPTNSVKLAQDRFFADPLPFDNYLPLLSVNRLYQQESLKPYALDWRSTDRPPLQSGICLMLRPYFLDPVEGYQAFSTFLNASILIGIASWLQNLGIRKGRALALCSLIAFSGTFLVNTVFVWSKLFPAMLLFALCAQLWRQTHFEKNLPFWILAGSTSALSLLMHPGSLFALIGIFAFYTLQHRRLHLNQFIAAAVVFAVFILPWSLYQKHYDPPGNMLQKRFFADHPQFDDVTFGDAVKEAYRNLTLESWIKSREHNLQVVVGDWRQAIDDARQAGFGSEYLLTRYFIFIYIGLSVFPAILGYPMALILRIRPERSLATHLWRFHGLTLLGMGLWILLILPSGRTIISHGTYFFPILIMLMGGLLIQERRSLLQLLIAANLVLHTIIWFLPRFRSLETNGMLLDIHIIDIPATLVLLASLMAVCLLITRELQRDEKIVDPSDPEPLHPL